MKGKVFVCRDWDRDNVSEVASKARVDTCNICVDKQ